MLTVPEASKIIIERSRYLSEALSKDLINLSSLARYIKPEIEEMLYKKVNNGSIVMALKRFKKDLRPKTSNVKIFKIPPQIHVATGLHLYRFKDFPSEDANLKDSYVTRVDDETAVVTRNEYKTKPLLRVNNVASIIIDLPEETMYASGIHYFFLKSLAWEGINIVETFSTSKKYILIFEEKDIHRSFRILTSLFTK